MLLLSVYPKLFVFRFLTNVKKVIQQEQYRYYILPSSRHFEPSNPHCGVSGGGSLRPPAQWIALPTKSTVCLVAFKDDSKREKMRKATCDEKIATKIKQKNARECDTGCVTRSLKARVHHS